MSEHITTLSDIVKGLHASYCRLTGMSLTLDMARESTWYWWQKKGFTEGDLKLVVRYLQGQIRQQRRNPGALKFSNLIGQYDLFEEDLAMARAELRNRQPAHNDRASVLQQTGRHPVAQASPPASSAGVPARDVIAKLQSDPVAAAKALEEFKAMKANL